MLFLIGVVLFLAVCDGLITYRVLSAYGIEVELNRIIQRLDNLLGLGGSIAIGIGLPTLGWITLAYTLRCPVILAMLIAARAGFLVKQLDVHRPQHPV